MSAPVIENGIFKLLTASTVVRTGGWQCLGIFVSAASATPTIEVLNAITSGTATCISVFTPIAGTWYPMPISGGTGITVLIGGTVAATLCWLPSPSATQGATIN